LGEFSGNRNGTGKQVLLSPFSFNKTQYILNASLVLRNKVQYLSDKELTIDNKIHNEEKQKANEVLGLVDDLICVSKCGYKTAIIHSFIKLKIKSKKLQFGVKKCWQVSQGF
jgi:hypothetical protein